MKFKKDKFYFEDKREQERFLKELENRWQKLMDTCKELTNDNK